MNRPLWTVPFLMFAAMLPGSTGSADTASAAATKTVQQFVVRASTKQSKLRGHRALLIRSLTIRGGALNATRPQVTCDVKNCVRLRRARTIGRRVTNRKYVFKNVNWLIPPGKRGLTVALLSRTKQQLGRFIRFQVTDGKTLRLSATQYGCVKTVARQRGGAQRLQIVSCPVDGGITQDPVASVNLFPNRGVFTTAPSLVRDVSGNTFVGAITTTGQLYETVRVASTGTWRNPLVIPGATGQPAGVLLSTGAAFAITTDDGSVQIMGHPDNDINTIAPMGSLPAGSSAGCPAALMRGSELDVVAASPAGGFGYWWLNGSSFNSITLGAAGSSAGCASIFLRYDGQFDYALADASGGLKLFTLPQSTTTAGSFPVGGAGSSQGCPAMIERLDRSVQIISISSSGSMLVFNGSSESGNFSASTIDGGHRFAGCPAAVLTPSGTTAVAATRDDGSIWIYSASAGAGSWTPFQVSTVQVGQGRLTLALVPGANQLQLVTAASVGVLSYLVPFAQ